MLRRTAMLLATTLWAMPARAQWLNPHLDAQRWNNLRRHQQRNRQPPRAAPGARSAEAEALRRQRMQQLRPEYERRVARDGQAQADQWLARRARELGRQDGAR
jgi:hypothetical protein